MKIERIEVTNFLGLRHLAIDVDAPVLLVCGPNGAGKSSLIEAIRFALTGETPRAALKKDYPTLLSAGQTAGMVSVTADGRQITRNVKTGAGTGAPDDLGALAYTLDAPRLARMDAKERRAALFGLMGVSFSSAVVAQELIDRGHMADHVERIKPILKSGFDAAATEAKKLAAEARGAWKEVTGETYGAVKAETWACADTVPACVRCRRRCRPPRRIRGGCCPRSLRSNPANQPPSRPPSASSGCVIGRNRPRNSEPIWQRSRPPRPKR